MKKCSYCGAEYPDAALLCTNDHNPLDPPGETSPALPPSEPVAEKPEFVFAPLSEEDMQKDLITLMRCRTLIEADVIISRLQAAGIETFIPDERLMQVIGWNLNTYGYVRVQISPKDYDTAAELLGRVEKGA